MVGRYLRGLFLSTPPVAGDSDGLKISIHGELGDSSALLNKPTPAEFKQICYGLEVEIPWDALRFLFYDEINFLLSNYSTYGPGH